MAKKRKNSRRKRAPAEAPGHAFLSYAHVDRERVEPLVGALEKGGVEVWWDDRLQVGEEWRRVIHDKIDSAGCVVVAWTRDSVRSTWVSAEAGALDPAVQRAALLGAKLDAKIRIPLPFGEFQCADLTDWNAGSSAELRKLVTRAKKLTTRENVESYQTLEADPWNVDGPRRAAVELRQVTGQIGSLGEILIADTAAAKDLRGALSEVHKTYRAVTKAVEAFVAPAVSHGALKPAAFVKFERGSLGKIIRDGQGHCTQIASYYGRRGGLRDWLSNDAAARKRLKQADRAFARLATADGDLFLQLAAIGDVLTHESRAIVNLLTTQQTDAARKRILRGRKRLQPLEKELEKGIRAFQAIERKLGYARKL